MKSHRKRSIATLCLLLALVWAATGCVREDFSGCRTSFTFTVRAYDADKVTELPDAVNDVVLYIFDRNDLFVREIETAIGATVEVTTPRDDIVKVVACGNLGGGNQTRPVFRAGDHISLGAVELLALSRAETTHRIPDDLFMGTATLVKDSRIVPIYRKPGKIGITIRGLRQYFGITDDDVSVVVNTTCGVIPFSGSRPQGEVSYRPAGAFTPVDEFVVEPSNIFAASGITIDILHGGRVLASVSTTDGASPIDVAEGVTTNILVVYRLPGNVEVNIALTAWGTYKMWKGYS